MGLRRSKIVNLVRSEVDLQKGFIRLSAERTKTNTPRIIPGMNNNRPSGNEGDVGSKTTNGQRV